MPTIVFGLVAVAVLVGFARMVYELKTGKFFARGWKVHKTREQNSRLYWTSMILEIFVALFVTTIFLMNWFRVLGKPEVHKGLY